MAAKRTEDLSARLLRLSHRWLSLPDFVREATTVIRPYIPFDGICWFTTDPATHLPTSHIAFDSLRPEDVPALARNEFMEEDVNKIADLACYSRPAQSLVRATGGIPQCSRRFRELLAPNGFADELRGALLLDGACWGGVAMYRRGGSPFESADADLLATVGPVLAEGVRRAILARAAQATDNADSPGLVLLGRDDTVEAISASARCFLDELVVVGSRPETGIPNVVHALAGRTRSLALGQTHEPARVRVQTATGRWLVLHGSMLEDGPDSRIAIIIEAAHPIEVAPLLLAAYGLSQREREVASLVLRGETTTSVAATLSISPYTVQDHLKAIFEKAGVRSRREFVARVFFDQYAPRMAHGENIDAAGQLV